MIAILHKDGIVHLFVVDVISIEDADVVGLDSAARGTTADILVVDGFTSNLDGSITDGTVTLRPGDEFNPSDFTDTRAKLPLTPEQAIAVQLEELTLALADIYANGGLS